MAYYKNKIRCLDELIDETYDGEATNEFSFLGLIDNHKHEKNEDNPNRIHHDLIMHDGSNVRLHIQYITGFDYEFIYDSRQVDDECCPFYPKGTMCFLPRLEMTYIDGDDIFCTFKGGDLLFGRMMEAKTNYERARLMHRRKEEEEKGHKIEPEADMIGTSQVIGPNRVVLILDLQPSAIESFLAKNEPLSIIQEGSIIHPAVLNKTAGLKWPIFPAHQSLLRKLLPVLIRTHHSIAFFDNRYHNINHHLGLSITEDLTKMVNIQILIYIYKTIKFDEEKEFLDYRIDATVKINRKMEGVQLMKVQSKDWLRRMKHCIYTLKIQDRTVNNQLTCSVCHYKSI